MNSTFPIDFDDIQSLVRFAHGRLSESAFLLLRIKDPEAARHWLAGAPVSTAGPADPLPATALQLAFSAAGLRALGTDDSVMSGFSQEFTSGICGDENRSRRLGDVGSNDPQHWRWGSGENSSPHLLVMLYTGAGKLDEYLQSTVQHEFNRAFETLTTLISKASGSEEPFGFKDGISQPLIDWQQTISTDLHERDNYINLMATGEILLGYPNEYGLYTARPLLDPATIANTQALPGAPDQPHLKDLGRNGTYLVLRHLVQDVAGFWQFVDRQAGGDAQQREQLAAAMVGRQRDGSPLPGMASTAVTGISPDQTDNRFTFDDDPLGLQCPIGSHIRRANPRTGDFPPGVTGMLTRLIRTLGFGRRHPGDDLVASSRFHRLLRRGRIFGSVLAPDEALRAEPAQPDGEERGLYFVCLGANISRQFEFVQNAWVMSSKFAGLPTESDPLLGNREPLVSGAATDRFTLPQTGAPARCINELPQFVTVKGGAYFFMPGLRALDFILRQKTN